MNPVKVLSPYRFPEIIQVFGICVSMLFFVNQVPDIMTGILWAVAMLASIASAFWLNDYFDFDDDKGNLRKDLHRTKKMVLVPAVGAFIGSMVCSALVSRGVFATAFLIAIASGLYSSPVLRLKSKIFFPFLIHFFMGIVFFQSAATITDFMWTTDAKLMGLFWALVLGTGSLGNELVDQSVDASSKIKTVANTYPSLIRKIIFGTLTFALVVLMADMVYLGLRISQLMSMGLGGLYLGLYVTKSKTMPPATFRKFYRIIFVVMILAFHAEKYFRN